MKKTILHILSRTVWTVVGLYAVLMVAIHVPSVQTFIASNIKEALEQKLATRVEINRVDLGFLNRVIIDGLDVYDKQKKLMLHTSRVSVKIDIIDALQGKYNITSAQLFGLQANLYKDRENAPFNFQFVIDSLKSKDTLNHTPLDLQISSLVIRNGSVKYDLNYIPVKHNGLDVNHLKLSKLSTHCILYKLTDEIIDLYVRHFGVAEKSGLQIKDLSVYGVASKGDIKLTDFELTLPHSSVKIPELAFKYNQKDGKLQKEGLKLKTSILADNIDLQDIQAVLPFNAAGLPNLAANISANGKEDNIDVKLAIKAKDGSLNLNGTGYCRGFLSDNLTWGVNPMALNVKSGLISRLNNIVKIPQQVIALGDVNISGKANGTKTSVDVDSKIATSECGKLSLIGTYNGLTADLHLNTDGINLGRILNNEDLGKVAADLKLRGTLTNKKFTTASIEASVGQFDFRNYCYQKIDIDGNYNNGRLNGILDVDDPNLRMTANVNASLQNAIKELQANLDLDYISPTHLNLIKNWKYGALAMHMKANINGSNIDNLLGSLSIEDLEVHGVKNNDGTTDDVYVDNIQLTSTKDGGKRNIELHTDDADLKLQGDFTPSHIADTFLGMIKKELPSLPGLNAKRNEVSDMAIDATIRSTSTLHRLFGVNVDIIQPIKLQGYVNGHTQESNLYLIAPSVNAFNHHIEDFKLLFWTPESSLRSTVSMQLKDENKTATTLNLETLANDGTINSAISWDNHQAKGFKGKVNVKSNLTSNSDGTTRARISIAPSNIQVGDSIWHLHSRDIVYTKNKLNVDHFTLGNDNQHIFVNGTASRLESDSLQADLKNIDVSYILNLVNFHSVEFGGSASGHFVGHSLFAKPEAHGHLDVAGFLFQYGRMGDLHANVVLNNTKKQLDIDAYADDQGNKVLDIKGFVSPQRNGLDLDITTNSERLDFMQYFCSSFMEDIDARGTGRVRLYGPFSGINLEGKIVADGALTVSSLNCRYQLKGDTVIFVPNDMRLSNQPIYDKYGNVAYFSGGLHHHCLSRMTYDFDIDAHNFLCYDFHDFGDASFYGTALMTGNCKITGRSSELTFDVTGDVEPGSSMVYNATSPDAITKQEFISWGSQNQTVKLQSTNSTEDDDEHDVRTNIHMNFLVNVTPKSTLRLLMDMNTGDYIDLNGSGTLHASYYNKGSLDLFGNYLIDNGVYKMTIQNVIRRDFDFLEGSSISFSGNPYSAALNMKARYTLNSVSLSDLNIGNSFSSNNIKVDCLMDITGTPGAPVVSFNLDPHTNNTEARQMIFSLINSEEELNQQVLYLLSVGRFYAQASNNASAQESRFNQTTLAMQSIVSGTLSQQFNRMLNKMVKNNNWNFGANISPGDEGFYNAEYEGILNGSFLNNRLFFNGQFGYRDKATTANQEFIGDFDLRYLLFPNGNFAVRVYNQTNDRYFTKNSLNTQGIGLILKKDFNSFADFFRRKK